MSNSIERPLKIGNKTYVNVTMDDSILSKEEQDDRTIESAEVGNQRDDDEDDDDYTLGTAVESVISIRGEIRKIKSGPGVGKLRDFTQYKGKHHDDSFSC